MIVADACGAGALPDAADYGDAGTNTLAHVAQRAADCACPSSSALGLGSILPLAGVASARAPVRARPPEPPGAGQGVRHRALGADGRVTPVPLPTYPDGLPRGGARRACAPRPDATSSATARSTAWRRSPDHGEAHLETGDLILYTSQDSVLQLAAHEDRVSVEELHALCERVRAVMDGEHAVGRVIARPFGGEPGAFVRRAGRRDYTVPPPGPTYLDALQAAGVPVHGVGKVADFFAGRGIDHAHPGADNEAALASTAALVDGLEAGLVFTNLVDTDQLLRPPQGRARASTRALRRIDDALAAWRSRLGADDLLLLTADHGCDPDRPGHRPHARARAAAGRVRRPPRPPPRRAAGRRRRHRARLADRRRRPRAARSARSRADARAPRGRDDPPPPGAEGRGPPLRRGRGRTTRAGRAPLAPDALAAALSGRPIERLDRRGKYLLWRSGRRRRAGPAPAHDRHRALRPAARSRARARPPAALRRARCSSSTTRAGSAPGTCCAAPTPRPPTSTRGSGPEPFDSAFTPAYLERVAARQPRPGQGRDPRPAARRRASGTSTPTRRSSAPRSTRSARRAGSRGPRSPRCARRSSRRSPTGSTRADPRSTTSATRAGSQGTFQDAFRVHLRAGEPCPVCGKRDQEARRRRARDLRLRAAASRVRGRGGGRLARPRP